MSSITLRNHKTSIRVHGALVAAGITRAGLSVREVARRCDLTFNIVYRITRHNEYSADLPVRHLAQLADLLDLTLTDLLDPRPTPAQHPDPVPPDTSGQHPDPDQDTRRLAAVLLLGGPVQGADTLAHGLGWDLPRLHAAQHQVNRCLAPLGVYSRNANDSVYLTTIDAAELWPARRDIQRIAVLETRDRPLTRTLARLLDRALHNQNITDHRKGDLPAVAYAVNTGHLAPGGPGQQDLAPSPAFLDAFPDL